MEFVQLLSEVLCLERLKTSDHVVGKKQSEKAVKQGGAGIAFVAEDTDPWVSGPFIELCEEYKVPVVMAPSMRELAKACRVDVPTAIAVLLK